VDYEEVKTQVKCFNEAADYDADDLMHRLDGFHEVKYPFPEGYKME